MEYPEVEYRRPWPSRLDILADAKRDLEVAVTDAEIATALADIARLSLEGDAK